MFGDDIWSQLVPVPVAGIEPFGETRQLRASFAWRVG